MFVSNHYSCPKLLSVQQKCWRMSCWRLEDLREHLINIISWLIVRNGEERAEGHISLWVLSRASSDLFFWCPLQSWDISDSSAFRAGVLVNSEQSNFQLLLWTQGKNVEFTPFQWVCPPSMNLPHCLWHTNTHTQVQGRERSLCWKYNGIQKTQCSHDSSELPVMPWASHLFLCLLKCRDVDGHS